MIGSEDFLHRQHTMPHLGSPCSPRKGNTVRNCQDFAIFITEWSHHHVDPALPSAYLLGLLPLVCWFLLSHAVTVTVFALAVGLSCYVAPFSSVIYSLCLMTSSNQWFYCLIQFPNGDS